MRRILQFFLIVMSALIGFLFAGAAWANPQAGSAVTQEQVKGSAGAASAPSYSASAATPAENGIAPLAGATTATSVENAATSKQQSGGPLAAPAAVVAAPGAGNPAAGAAHAAPAAAATAAAANDPHNFPPSPPADESADAACQNYFSAYGLTPKQMRWIERNRKKLFPNVCPAPDPARVNFVIIFTHDVNFFNVTMPTPVHQDAGFSDFTAMTPLDIGQMSTEDAERAHREYVWIFEFASGTFDPGNFSPRRRYQYSKVEANALGGNAGVRTVEDAFRFVAGASR